MNSPHIPRQLEIATLYLTTRALFSAERWEEGYVQCEALWRLFCLTNKTNYDVVSYQEQCLKDALLGQKDAPFVKRIYYAGFGGSGTFRVRTREAQRRVVRDDHGARLELCLEE